MFIPVPVLILTGVIVVALIVFAWRRSSDRDSLMGSGLSSPKSPQVNRPAASQTGPAPAMPPATRSQVVELLGAGRKIEAIKLAREHLRVDLRTAKELVEEVEGQG